MAMASQVRMTYGKALTSDEAEERLAAAGWAADEYFRQRGQKLDRSSPAYRSVLDDCARALAEAVIAKDELERGRPEPEPSLSKLAKATSEDLSKALAEQGRLRLLQYFDDVYVPIGARGAGTPLGERNIGGKRHSARLFTEMVGNKHLCTIKKSDGWAFLDHLLRYPDRRLLTGDLKRLAATEVLKRVETGTISLPSMSWKTANKHVSNVSSILHFAGKRLHIEPSDFKGVNADGEDEQAPGRPFTTDELNRIFSQPIFAGCAGEHVEAGLFKPGTVRIRDDRFWIPLTLLFTGARSAEIVGLLTSEAVVDHEVPHFLIQPNEVRKRLKNKPSRRMIPIHPSLIELGFLEFARSRVSAGELRLFPMAEQTTYRDGATGEVQARSLSAALIMRQFNRTILARADAQKDRGSIKCFRNTFEQESLAKITSDEIRQRLTGRTVVSSNREYVDNIPRDPRLRSTQLVRLRTEIVRIAFDGLNLDHLRPA